MALDANQLREVRLNQPRLTSEQAERQFRRNWRALIGTSSKEGSVSSSLVGLPPPVGSLPEIRTAPISIGFFKRQES